ncbi:MAG: hypothetical protein ACI4EN_00875 [Butyrivibrio sp.]
MKIRDSFKLVKYEYHYGKAENIASFLMNSIIFTCILLSLTITTELSKVFNDYMSKAYPDGYIFRINGFNENDIKWLEERGFYDIDFYTDGTGGTAVTKDISNIWSYKFRVLISGKDIWNEEIDEMLEVVLFADIVFTAITIILCVIFINSNSNSFSMKLEERKKYIDMLIQLGMNRGSCISVFVLFFMTRVMFAVLFSICINGMIICFVDDYIIKIMHIRNGFSLLRPDIAGAIIILSILIMIVSFQKIWREKYEL